jgi:hypothetical protein
MQRNKLRQSPNEGIKLKRKITANLTEAEQYKSQQLASQSLLQG